MSTVTRPSLCLTPPDGIEVTDRGFPTDDYKEGSVWGRKVTAINGGRTVTGNVTGFAPATSGEPATLTVRPADAPRVGFGHAVNMTEAEGWIVVLWHAPRVWTSADPASDRYGSRFD